jgi:hypothetical protein
MPSDAAPQSPLPAPAPEVRQQSDPDADQFGAVAVAAGPDRWGVMHPANGGHWAVDAEVQDWPVIELRNPSEA